MGNIRIITDSASDMPVDYREDVTVVPLFLTARLALAILHFLGAMVSRSAEDGLHQIQLPTSFYPHCHDADPCGYERSCEYADHGRADHGGGAGHGSSQYPSDA